MDDFVEVPAGKYIVGVGTDVQRLAIAPDVTWPDYPLAAPEQMIEIARPFQISRDLVTTHQYQRSMKQPLDGPDEPIALPYFEARKAARALGGELPLWFEWEIAARGPEPFMYPWGNELETTKLTLSTHTYTTEPSGPHTLWLLDSFGDYARTESPFGLRDLARVGCEWNEAAKLAGEGAVVRSLCDAGAMQYMVPGIRPGTEPTPHDTASTFAARAFSGPIAACYGLAKPDHYRQIVERACFRLVKR